MTSPRQHRWARRLAWAALVIVALFVGLRLALDPIAAHETRQGLARMQGFRGDFDRVHVTLFPLGYTITHLKVIQEPGGRWEAPIFYAERTHVDLVWHRLLRRQLVAKVRIVRPKIIVENEATKPSTTAKRAPDLSTELRQVTPLDVERIEIVRGELLFRDRTEPRRPELWVHRLDVAAENLATRERLAAGRPTTLSAKGTVGRSGALDLFVSADPYASPLAFAGRFELVGLRAAELYDWIEEKTKLQAPEGTVSLYAEFRASGGRIEGGVKPVLENVHVAPAAPGVWDKLKAWLADTGIKLASDRVPGRNAVATTVPIEGRLVDPDVQLWPAILGVVRNAFVEGVSSGFAHLPPPEAPHREGKLDQAKHALEKKQGPPKAQPEGKGSSK
ncbi:MAG TPA: DUF748 domain-containing protein [Polyangia bacterium]|nr:DUF748 domain-containing protein [Polyangia bacterium]